MADEKSIAFRILIFAGFLINTASAQLANNYELARLRIIGTALGTCFAVFLILGIIAICLSHYAGKQREKNYRNMQADNYAGSVYAVSLERGYLGPGHAQSVSGSSWVSGPSGHTSYAQSSYAGSYYGPN
ncbi:unnamed protein product [Owenia fusiformis]|uniref:Uncharacterized protein n=1 Tax=Owenia fusiformis TaxID=6347 RepID=A0A8S4Q1Z5_OWEFU|nr:unnamed protein product [Owenia fusiformis]